MKRTLTVVGLEKKLVKMRGGARTSLRHTVGQQSLCRSVNNDTRTLSSILSDVKRYPSGVQQGADRSLAFNYVVYVFRLVGSIPTPYASNFELHKSQALSRTTIGQIVSRFCRAGVSDDRLVVLKLVKSGRATRSRPFPAYHHAEM